METTLLCFCLSLRKVSFVLCTCPPSYIREATSLFNDAMLDAVSDLIGEPLSKWSWKKASLPAFLGGLGVRSASLHVPAAYLGSVDQSEHLVSRILGSKPSASRHLAPALEDLAINAK